ncbi:hypothetical protein GCM10009543_09980 [Leifsonia naganoensis]
MGCREWVTNGRGEVSSGGENERGRVYSASMQLTHRGTKWVIADTVYSHLYPSDYSAEIAQFEAYTAAI